MKSLKERFWRFVKKTDTCWEWIGRKNRFGYGLIGNRYKDVKAHRISYKIYIGKIPEGMLVIHSCDNPSCVNPEHLRLGTQKENIRDMVKKKRHSFGEKNGQAKLTNAEVRKIRFLFRTNNYYGYQRILAKRFSISPTTICEIVHNKKHKII